ERLEALFGFSARAMQLLELRPYFGQIRLQPGLALIALFRQLTKPRMLESDVMQTRSYFGEAQARRTQSLRHLLPGAFRLRDSRSAMVRNKLLGLDIATQMLDLLLSREHPRLLGVGRIKADA